MDFGLLEKVDFWKKSPKGPLTRATHNDHMGFLWVSCGFLVGFLWVSCGFLMGFLWAFYEAYKNPING